MYICFKTVKKNIIKIEITKKLTYQAALSFHRMYSRWLFMSQQVRHLTNESHLDLGIDDNLPLCNQTTSISLILHFSAWLYHQHFACHVSKSELPYQNQETQIRTQTASCFLSTREKAQISNRRTETTQSMLVSPTVEDKVTIKTESISSNCDQKKKKKKKKKKKPGSDHWGVCQQVEEDQSQFLVS